MGKIDLSCTSYCNIALPMNAAPHGNLKTSYHGEPRKSTSWNKRILETVDVPPLD
jgi:hypothetical protein